MRKLFDKALSHRLWPNGRYALFGAILLVLLGLLVRQQLNWLNQASASQLASGQKELSLALTQGLDDIRTDMQQLYRDVTQGGNHELVLQHLHIRFDQKWPSYAEDDPRQPWVDVFSQSAEEPPNPFELERVFERRRAADEFLVVSVEQPKIELEEFELHILVLDLPALANSIILPSLTEALADYHFEMTLNQQTLLNRNVLNTSQKPDVVLPISRLIQLPLQERRQRSEEANDYALTSFDRDFSQLYNSILNAIQQPKNTQSSKYLNLSVYSPDGSIEERITWQKWRNAFFSIMILSLLSITVIVLLGMTRRIKSQQQRERDFISSISHELRTPLTVIRSAADNLKDGVVTAPESIARYGLEISKQSKRLSRMIDTTLTYSGLPGRDSQQLESVNGDAFFRDLFEPLITVAAEQDVTCHLKIENLDTSLTLDTDALRTIGQNLVMNALIHAKPEIDPAQLWLKIYQQDNKLILTVADNGQGIPKKEQRHVFSPFVRGKHSEHQQKPGTGLGLSLVRRTAAILQGEVSLQSPYQSDLGQTEHGCLFTVTLPLRPTNDT